MRKRFLTIVGIAAGLTLTVGALASAASLPTGASTLTGSGGVATSDGSTPQTFTGAQYTFTSLDDSSYYYGANAVIIVDVKLPTGVTLTGAAFDGSSTCNTTNGVVSVSGNIAHVSGVACTNTQTLVVNLDGSSLITNATGYDVSAQYKRVIPRRARPRNGYYTNMWQTTDTGGFTVGS
jgi:hypothetical protein